MCMNNGNDIHQQVLIHSFRIPRPGIQKKVIWHFSDTHLNEYDDLSSPQEKEQAEKLAEGWPELRKFFANQNGEPCGPELQRSPKEHFETLMELAKTGDALVLAGDICDSVNGANLRLIQRRLQEHLAPFLAVCGNHDTPDQIPDGLLYSRAKAPVQILDLGDMVIIGIDNSSRQVTALQNERLEQLLQEDKPVLILMHIPLSTPENAELLESRGEYFRLDHPEAGPEVSRFRELIRDNASRIIAVLAGHLHFGNVSQLVPGVTQYVSSQGILGNINRYEIGE